MKNNTSHHHKITEPVSFVFSFTVRKGKEKEFEAWAHEITRAVTHFEGHLGSNWIRTGPYNYIVIIRFFDVDDSKKWLRSTVRSQLIQKAYPLIVEKKANRLQNVTGLETWFTLPGKVTIKPPPRWKMVLVTMIGIYPIGLVYQAYLVTYFKILPLLFRPIALSLLLTPILTYVIMPQLTKIFRKWLYPDL